MGRVDGFAARGNPRHKGYLLLTRSPTGPLAFAKIGGSAGTPEVTTAQRLLTRCRTTTFRVPHLIATGSWGYRHYQLFEPLLPWPHRIGPADRKRLGRIVDEYREALNGLSPPPTMPTGHVPSHGDLHLVNLRATSDGGWWLFDWEDAAWRPRLVDEVHFWTSHVNTRATLRWLLETLRGRGTHDDILEALRWPEERRRRALAVRLYRDLEGALTS